VIDYKKRYEELVDVLCSKAWLGRERHASVLALAKRLHDSQRTLRPLELEDVALAAGYCIRKSGHEGPCNGLPRNDCHQRATKEEGKNVV
jgi:hypothetical protein